MKFQYGFQISLQNINFVTTKSWKDNLFPGSISNSNSQLPNQGFEITDMN